MALPPGEGEINLSSQNGKLDQEQKKTEDISLAMLETTANRRRAAEARVAEALANDRFIEGMTAESFIADVQMVHSASIGTDRAQAIVAAYSTSPLQIKMAYDIISQDSSPKVLAEILQPDGLEKAFVLSILSQDPYSDQILAYIKVLSYAGKCSLESFFAKTVLLEREKQDRDGLLKALASDFRFVLDAEAGTIALHPGVQALLQKHVWQQAEVQPLLEAGKIKALSDAQVLRLEYSSPVLRMVVLLHEYQKSGHLPDPVT